MNKLVLSLLILLGLTTSVFFVFAATGTIDTTYKYAWSNNAGWINFGCTYCNVQVTDTAITGYAWSQNYGWIKLDPNGGGILNSGGNLSGSAWGENTGWVNFGNVEINSSGQFTGTASGDVVGTVSFSGCGSNCGVTTTWRAYRCGDGVCNGVETCATCLSDCGACGGGVVVGGDIISSHNECNAQKQCVSVNTAGVDQCNSNNDCESHTHCNSQNNQCETVSGSGANECTTSNDCAIHNECNAQKQCVQVVGQPAPDQCQVNGDCNLTHTICDGENIICRFNGCTGLKCVEVNGAGDDQCGNDSDCSGGIHNECNAQKQCVLKDGVGPNLCLLNSDCGAIFNACENEMCVPKSGIESDQCQLNSDCATTHSECDDQNKCVSVSGAGTNQCQIDGDCIDIGGGGKHNECNAQKQCVAVDGVGNDQCTISSDCLITHNECNLQNQCVVIEGVGINQCQADINCSASKHNECNAQNQCVAVDGVGSDQCQTNGDCITTHNECNDQKQCVAVNGSGINQCETNANCNLEKHNECNDQKQCVAVDGVGNNQCSINGDCLVTHSECNLDNQCVAIEGVGINQCATNANCILSKHNECNAQNQCVVVDGVGSDQCQTNGDCVTTHNECNDQKQCVAVNGSGTNQCENEEDCDTGKHNECNDQSQCVVVNGSGPNLCQLDGDCLTTHNECNNLQCTAVVGIGIDQCNINQECQTPKHNECNSSQQCTIVDGTGDNQCQTNNDCIIIGGVDEGSGGSGGAGGGGGGGNVVENVSNFLEDISSGTGQAAEDIVMNTAKAIDTVTTNIIESLPAPARAVAEQTKRIIESPQGSAITKAVATTGFVVTAVASTAPILSFNFFELFLVPLRLLGILLTALGIRKKSLPWGVVYDSVTKRPLDPAYVVLKDLQGKTISTAVTDLDGRFGFLAAPGTYQILAHKTNYNFPSKKLLGKNHDELHFDLYFGENITISTAGAVIIKNIPLDPIKFDWNEFAKQDKSLMRFYSKWDIILRKIYDFSFISGFIVAVIACIFAPYPYNTIIMGMYLFLLVLRIFGLKPKTYGHISDKATGFPLSFAIIRVMIPGSEVVVTSKSADKYGKYYCLVPPGKYYIKIEKKNVDGSYSLAYTSPTIDVSHKGIIKEMFKI